MTDRTDGGDSARIAPVIPLFGRDRGAPDGGDEFAGGAAARGGSAATADSARWRSTWEEPVRRGALSEQESESGTPSDRHPARGGARGAAAPRLRALREPALTETEGPDREEVRRAAAESLVRKLRTRSLSVAEARTVLKGHGLEAELVDETIDDFCRRGYLDDAVLAESLVSSGIERKGQGRVALARGLSQRGIPRAVIDAALEALPDDDAERALEFARTKARSLSRLEHETALRRLVGQLARRGYGGSIAMTAATTALREATFGQPTTSVRFVDSDDGDDPLL